MQIALPLVSFAAVFSVVTQRSYPCLTTQKTAAKETTPPYAPLKLNGNKEMSWKRQVTASGPTNILPNWSIISNPEKGHKQQKWTSKNSYGRFRLYD